MAARRRFSERLLLLANVTVANVVAALWVVGFLQPHALGVDVGHAADGPRDESIHIRRLHIQRELAHLDTREIKNLADERVEILAALKNGGGVVPLFGVERTRDLLEQHVGEADH